MSDPRAHSFLSPSNTIAAKCPAAAQRQHLVEERISFLKDKGSYLFNSPQREKFLAAITVDEELANLGTAVHKIYEDRLEGLETIPEGMKKLGVVDPFIEDGLEHLAREVEEQMSLAAYAGTETKTKNLGVNSGGSLDAWYVIYPRLSVRDLKSGRIEVLAEDNVQLLRYGCGLMDHLGWPKEITHIDLHIDGLHFSSSKWTVTHQELREWRDGELLEFMTTGNLLNPPAIPGGHCEHCSAKAHCGESQGWVKSGINQFPTNFLEAKTEDLEDLFILMKVAKNMHEQIRDELKQRFASGFAQPSKLKVLPGRSYTKFKVEDQRHIIDSITLSPEITLNKPEEIKTPNQLMKVVGENEKLKQLIMTYDFKRNSVDATLEAFKKAGYEGDNKALLKPLSMKTPTLLKTMFSDSEEALALIDELKGAELYDALVPFVKPEVLVLTQPTLKSASKIRDAIDFETLQSLTNVGQHSPILTQA